MTGAALEALNAVKHPDAEGQKKAFEYLREGETPNGGFAEFLTEGEPNVASTAWVAQAMWSAGINPEEWLKHSGLATEEPLGYLASMQQPDGHIRYEAGEEMNGMWMTAYVTPAFTGNPLPIPEVPYVDLPPGAPDSEQPGNGGVSPQPGRRCDRRWWRQRCTSVQPPPTRQQGPHPGRRASSSRTSTTTRPSTAATQALLAKHLSRQPPSPASTAPRNTTRPDHKGTGGVALTGAGAGGGGQNSSQEVKGLLIGAPADSLKPGAPGLRGAGAGRKPDFVAGDRHRRCATPVRPHRRPDRAAAAQGDPVSTLAATDGLAEALARIASSLRIPVLILALLVLLVCAVEVGRFAIELWSQRARRTRRTAKPRSPGRRQPRAGRRALGPRAKLARERRPLGDRPSDPRRRTGRHRARARRLRARGPTAPGPHPHPRPRRTGTRPDGHPDPACTGTRGTRPRRSEHPRHRPAHRVRRDHDRAARRHCRVRADAYPHTHVQRRPHRLGAGRGSPSTTTPARTDQDQMSTPIAQALATQAPTTTQLVPPIPPRVDP